MTTSSFNALVSRWVSIQPIHLSKASKSTWPPTYEEYTTCCTHTIGIIITRMNQQAGRQTDGQTDRQTDSSQTDRAMAK